MTDNIAWIQTFTGKRLDLDPPNPDQIDIEDIAHGLSMLCRFNGQCTQFYSVAEHSVHVSHEIAPKFALVGLLHDAAEAYLGDVPSPLKKQLSQFKTFEGKMEVAIGKKFDIKPDLFKDRELKRADVQLLIDEKAVLMVDPPEPWPPGAPDVKDASRIECWEPALAKQKFLERFAELTAISPAPNETEPPMILPDILSTGLKVIFCGTAVGRTSAREGRYYANKGNSFWKTLFEIGLTDEPLTPERQLELLQYGVGLTDLNKFETGMDRQVSLTQRNAERLVGIVEAYKPRSVAFNGKKAAETVFGRKVDYGMQARSTQFGDVDIWVLPSTSGAGRGYFDIDVWNDFAAWLSKTG